MTEGAMSEAMITEHQLLAVDHANMPISTMSSQ